MYKHILLPIILLSIPFVDSAPEDLTQQERSVFLLSKEKKVLEEFFSASALSESALKYDAQVMAIRKVPTKSLVLPNPSTQLASIVDDIATRLHSRMSSTHILANAAVTSSTHRPEEKWKICCEIGNSIADEAYYSNYYKQVVSTQKMCTRGACRAAQAGRVLSDTPSCAKSVLGQVFLDVASNNSYHNDGGAWQYFGSELGVFTTFPSASPGKGACGNDNVDEYDPRVRPWYLNALAEKPMDVAIIVDKSGSMLTGGRMESAQKAVKGILKMLRPYDRFGVAAFSSSIFHEEAETNHTCHKNQLSYATKKNVDQVSKWVDTISPQGQTLYTKGIEYAMKMFSNVDNPKSEVEERLEVFIFISDGDPTDYKIEIMEKMKEFMIQQPELIVLTYGLDVTNDILQDMAAHQYSKYSVTQNTTGFHAGTFTALTPQDIRLKLGTFYGHSAIRNDNTDVHFTLPYIDSMGLGLMTTASRAVYASGNLQGVVGYDITLDYLLEPVEYFVTESSYAFLLESKRGYVFAHPRLMNPQAKVTDISPVHYSVFESDSDIVNDIESIISGIANSTASTNINRNVTITMDEGVNTYEHVSQASFKTETVDVYCDKVEKDGEDFNLILCIVANTVNPTKMLDEHTYYNEKSKLADFMYHRTDLDMRANGKRQYCRHGFRIARKATAAVKFSPRQYAHPTQYLTINETQTTVTEVGKWIQNSPTTNDGSQLSGNTYIDAKFDSPKRSKAYVMLSQGLDENWVTMDSQLNTQYKAEPKKSKLDLSTDTPIAVWRYFGAADGTQRVWPGVRITNRYDPTMRPWYRLAMTNSSKLFLSTPYLDAFGMGYVVTLTRAVKLTDGEVAGVLGTDYYVKQIGDMINGMFLDCLQGSNCLLMDGTGNIIWWNEMSTNNDIINVADFPKGREGPQGTRPLNSDDVTFDGKVLSKILVDDHDIPVVKCHDTLSQNQRYSLDIDLDDCSEDTVSSLCPWPGTNVYMFIKSGKAEYIGPGNTGAESKKITNAQKSQQQLQRKETDYMTCDNEFLNTDIVPACQGPAAHLDENYLGQFSKDGFSLENLKSLDSCYDWMDKWFFYAIYPSSIDFSDLMVWMPYVGGGLLIIILYCCCCRDE